MGDKLSIYSVLADLKAHQIELEFQNEELRLTQAALINSQQEYRELFDYAPIGYLMYNQDGIIINANLTAARMFEIERESILHLSFTKFIYSDDQDLFYHYKKKLDLTLRSHSQEIRLNKNKNEPFWAFISSTFAYQKNDQFIYRMVIKDITDRKNAEFKALIEKTKFEDLIFALNHSAIVSILNSLGQIQSVNDKFCEISGYSKNELVGNNSNINNSIFHSHDFFEKLPELMSPEKTWTGVVCNTNKDGNLYWLECTITQIQQADNHTIFIAIYFDITSRKLAEQLLLQSSKMASLGEMASGIAHEINNPLAIIVGITNRIRRMFSENTYKPEDILIEVEKIKSTSLRISKIIKGLHSFSRNAENDPFELISIKKLITETLEVCRERYKFGGVQIIIENIFDCEIECRGAQISQVFLNLLNNSFDAIQTNSTKWVKLEMNQPSIDRIQVIISDSGQGIPKEISEKIMMPFFTTKIVNKGTGLGLSISKRIIEDHWGKLYLKENTPNTTFVIEMPVRQIREHAEKLDLH